MSKSPRKYKQGETPIESCNLQGYTFEYLIDKALNEKDDYTAYNDRMKNRKSFVKIEKKPA
jgi:hypothetical protein